MATTLNFKTAISSVFIGILVIISTIPIMGSASTFDFEISWRDNDSEYLPGQNAQITIQIKNTCGEQLAIIWIGLHTDWMDIGTYTINNFTSSPIIIKDGDLNILYINYSIPNNISISHHSRNIGVKYQKYQMNSYIDYWWESSMQRDLIIVDFFISINPPNLKIEIGKSKTFTVKINNENGFSKHISLMFCSTAMYMTLISIMNSVQDDSIIYSVRIDTNLSNREGTYIIGITAICDNQLSSPGREDNATIISRINYTTITLITNKKIATNQNSNYYNILLGLIILLLMLSIVVIIKIRP